MLFVISRVAGPNFAELREKKLQFHLDYLRSQKNIIVLSGATTSDDGKEFVGSLSIINVVIRDEAQSFVNGDPFFKAGMYKDVKITRMRKGQWDPQAADGADEDMHHK